MASKLEELIQFLKGEVRFNDTVTLEFDQDIPSEVELEFGEDREEGERVYYDGFLFTDGSMKLVSEDESEDGTSKTKTFTIRNATWAVVIDATTHESWSGDSWKELGIVVYGSRDVFEKVRNILEEIGVYYTVNE